MIYLFISLSFKNEIKINDRNESLIEKICRGVIRIFYLLICGTIFLNRLNVFVRSTNARLRSSTKYTWPIFRNKLKKVSASKWSNRYKYLCHV